MLTPTHRWFVCCQSLYSFLHPKNQPARRSDSSDRKASRPVRPAIPSPLSFFTWFLPYFFLSFVSSNVFLISPSHFWNSSILFFVARAILARSLSLRVSVRHFLGHLFLWIPWPVFVDMSNSCFLLGRSSIDSGSQCIYIGTLFSYM